MRSQLIVILQQKLFNETSDFWDEERAEIFRNEYPRFPTIEVLNTLIFLKLSYLIKFQELNITEEEKTYSIDLRPFMNPSPYTVLHVSLFFFST